MAEDGGAPEGPSGDDDPLATRGFVRTELRRFATKADLERFGDQSATREDFRLPGVRLEHPTEMARLILERLTDLIRV